MNDDGDEPFVVTLLSIQSALALSCVDSALPSSDGRPVHQAIWQPSGHLLPIPTWLCVSRDIERSPFHVLLKSSSSGRMCSMESAGSVSPTRRSAFFINTNSPHTDLLPDIVLLFRVLCLLNFYQAFFPSGLCNRPSAKDE